MDFVLPLVFVPGLAFGSFLGVVAARVPLQRIHGDAALQWAYGKDPAHGFDPSLLPERFRHPEGKRVFALWWFVFPNLTLNFYPWGLSLNRVCPQAIDRTRVEFRSYVWDETKVGSGAGGALHEVELEDEAVVEAVQRGVRSRFYRHGRYSPTRERGTHHFHRLLCEFMAAAPHA